MCMPKITVPVPRPRTDNASSISVVAESSIEKACTFATGSASVSVSGNGGGIRPAPNL